MLKSVQKDQLVGEEEFGPDIIDSHYAERVLTRERSICKNATSAAFVYELAAAW
jgi:hypothetical protein